MKRCMWIAILLVSCTSYASAAERQQVRFLVSGSYCMGCSEVLTETLKEAGLLNASRVAPNRNGPVIVLGEIAPDADLGKLAATVNKAETPHRKQAPPGLALEVFAELDKADPKAGDKALQALEKVPGVDAKASKAVPSAGRLEIKLTGEKPVRVADVLAALKAAGVEARVVGDAR